ncbi:MAG TPA: hypothetical protein VLB84_07150, partial [Bacteroidia bacterium]|nr:hypothetical protein [Bacteroidia bacterium]
MKKNTIEFYNCDERKLALESVQYKTNSAVVVLGSSRTAVLDSTFFEKSLLNLSLSSSSIEDMIAIYGSYIRNHKPPQIVTIGVDPYIFNGNRVRNMKNFVLIHDYNLMMQNMHLTVSSEQTSDLEIMSSKFLNAVSFKYFQQSITFILKNGIKALRPTISTNNATVSLKNKNGVLIYPYKWNSRAGQVDSLVEQDISNDDLVGINGFTKISDARVSLFTSFVHFLASNHIEVILLLTPYHPLMINYIHSQPKYKIISDSEKLIRRIADTEKTKVIGSFVS